MLFPILTSDRADLSLGGRLNLAAAKNFDPQFTLEAPLRIECYASEHFSLHGEVGVAIEIVGDRGRLLGGAGILSTSSAGTGFIAGGTLVTAGGGFDVSFWEAAMKTLITIALAVAALLAAPRAHAQDDNATGGSGHDPNAQPELKTVEIEGGPVTGEGAARHDHTFGLGVGQTPAGLSGAEAEYGVGGPLMLDGITGFDLFSPKNGDSATAIGAGAALFYRWKVWDHVALMAGGRLELEHIRISGSTHLGTPQPINHSVESTQLDIEVPLRAQVYFAGVLAVHAEVAAVPALVTHGGGVLGSEPVSKGTYFALPLTNLIGAFGATYYSP